MVQEEQDKDLKTIIYESEKHDVQIEGQNETDTLTGSGFLYNNQGDIITNAHGIQDADLIYVRTSSARIYSSAVVGVSEDTDIAVIRVPQREGQRNPTINKKTSPTVGNDAITQGR